MSCRCWKRRNSPGCSDDSILQHEGSLHGAPRQQYGPPEVLKLTEVEKPAPRDGEVIVKVHATSLNSYDLRLLKADPFLVRLMGGGFFKPKHRTLGVDIAGRVETAGNNVTRLKPGDAVFGDLSGCGAGGLAEYARAPEAVLALKPAGMDFEEAAVLPMAAVTALHALRDSGGIRPGQKVLINGASGGVGTFGELVEARKVRPVIDRRYPLSEAVEAFRYLEEGHARGKIVITME